MCNCAYRCVGVCVCALVLCKIQGMVYSCLQHNLTHHAISVGIPTEQ